VRQAKSTAKADAQKEAKAAKDACAKNQAACDNAKTAAKNAVKVKTVRWGYNPPYFQNMLPPYASVIPAGKFCFAYGRYSRILSHEPASKQAVTRYRPDPWRSLVCPIAIHIG
jgi:hypothetical protein